MSHALRAWTQTFAVALLVTWAAVATPARAVVGSSPEPAIETNGEIDAVLATGGRTFIGGNFTRAGAAVGSGADLAQSDGAANLAFAKPNGTVSAAVSDGTGGWFVGGAFTRIGSVPRNRLAHLLADGSVDRAFDPNLNATVNALVRAGDRLFVAGQFTSVNGAVSRFRIAVLDVATGIATSFAPRVNGAQVMSIAMSDTTLYAGGGFTSVGSPAVTRNRIAAFDTTTTGTALPFDPNVNGSVSALAVSGSTVYAGGLFTLVNGTSPGVARNRLAAFDGASGAALPGFDPNANSTVNALALAGGTLYAGGAFSLLNGSVSRNNIAALDPATGTVLGGFDPNLDGTVNAVAVGGSRVYAGGTFSFAGAGTVRNRLAAIRADGTLDPTFDANVSGSVRALAISGSTLYAGGDFTTVNGATPRNRLAAFDTTTGTAVASFDADAGATVRALAVSGSKLYAGGDFTTVDGATPRNRLAAFDLGSGAVDGAFDPNLSSTVDALGLSGGKLYAGGSFTTVDGTTTRNRLAAFDPGSGAVDGAFNPNVNGTVSALAVAGSKVYAGGSFQMVNGAVARNRLAAFDAGSGAALGGFDPNVNASVNALALSGSTLYAGGDFTTVNGATARNRLAAFDTGTGVADADFNPNAGGAVFGLAYAGARLHVGGGFITIGPNARLRYARFAEPAPVATTGAPTAVTGTSATLTGKVNPNGLATTYVFEYGPTLSFGSITAADDATAASVSAPLSGLAPQTTTYYRLVATSSAGTSFGTVMSFSTSGTPQPPIAVTLTPTAVGTTTAALAGQVNPNGQATTFTFELGTSTSFGQITEVVALDDAIALEPVSAALSGLTPDTTYYARVVATNAAGTTSGAVVSFNTGPGGAPIVTTGDASAITPSAATLSGTVDPHGAQTTFTFEYGTTTAFGSIAAIDVAGATNGPLAVSLPITGLAPGTTYRYRMVATNANGTTTGAVGSFTTG